jgi:hypothetical protein
MCGNKDTALRRTDAQDLRFVRLPTCLVELAIPDEQRIETARACASAGSPKTSEGL